LQEQPKKIRIRLSPQAERYVQHDAPREVRLMASKGALPLPPIELAAVLFALMHDPDAEVKSTARDSLENLPDSVCHTVLNGETHPAVLAHLAHAFHEDEARLEMLALNSATDDRTIAFLAATPYKRLVDIISNNQVRLVRSSAIVDALGANPLTGRAVIERILNFLGVDTVAGEDTFEGASGTEDVSNEQAEAALKAILGEDLGRFAQELVHESDSDDEPNIDDGNLYSLIQSMSVMQKIKLARMGNREARGLLSPKMTLQEVATIAKARNVSDEVLRVIARNREWTRDYQVKCGLATNPKSPLTEAMKFVNYLQDRELKNLMRSKDVPTAIATHARRILMKKGKI